MAEQLSVEGLGALLAQASEDSGPDGPRIVVSGNLAFPQSMIDLIDASCERYVLHALNATVPIPDRPGVTVETAFVGAAMRRHSNLRYLPVRLSMLPLLFWRTARPDAVLVHTSAPFQQRVSLGIEVNVLPAAIEAAHAHGKPVIAISNPLMPYTFGDGEFELEDIDYLVEMPGELLSPIEGAVPEVAQVIGDQIAAQIVDGATLQMGIGAVPDAVLNRLSDHRGLRIWSEMFSDGVLSLERVGAMDSDQPIAASFSFGSAELYAWMDKNPRVLMLRTERINDPAYIRQHQCMTSVNAALQVDLHGQANASRVNGRIYSGFGGQSDFIVGALHAPGGQAFIALPSWHPRANTSSIIPQIDVPVTSFQQTAVVTEQGAAWLFGRTESEQAAELIERAAHPDVRDELREAAALMGLADVPPLPAPDPAF